MGSIWGKNVRISLFGESHGSLVGVVIDGLPAGIPVVEEEILFQMKRRAPGQGLYSTKRKEADFPEIQSGVLNGFTTGAPLSAFIKNTDRKSGDYGRQTFLPRPGHADYTAHIRYRGYNDVRGGGHFSARLTAPLVFAGAICRTYLSERNIRIGAHLSEVCGIKDESFDEVNLTREMLEKPGRSNFPVINEISGEKMLNAIAKIAKDGDSAGGIVECAVLGVPAGVGNHMFDNIESVISSILFAVPAVKGIEFGSGFNGTRKLGSENNDEFYISDDKNGIATKTNNAGGILGGISTGMPIMLRAAFKPTPSVYKKQATVDLSEMINSDIKITGRHDPCVAVRAVPVVEAACAVAVADLLMDSYK